MRCAAIEVGSRAVRLLIADVTPTAVTPIDRKVENFDLLRAVGEGRGAATLAKIQQVVDGYRTRAAGRGAVKIIAFGTEALRRLDASGDLPTLAGVDILSPRDEAFCSFLSSVNGLPGKVRGDNVVSVDHGNGSLEIAYGHPGSSSALADWRSLALGSNDLVALLNEVELDLGKFQARVQAALDVASLSFLPVSDIVIQGSVSTKIAWIALRPNFQDRYDGEVVHGYRASLEALRGIVTMADEKPRNEWDQLSRLIDPRDKPTDQIHRLVTGCVLFEQLLHRFGLNSFLVSSLGTRHGVLWRLAHDAIN